MVNWMTLSSYQCCCALQSKHSGMCACKDVVVEVVIDVSVGASFVAIVGC